MIVPTSNDFPLPVTVALPDLTMRHFGTTFELQLSHSAPSCAIESDGSNGFEYGLLSIQELFLIILISFTLIRSETIGIQIVS